ncbi:MAG: hypothetical protein PSY14_12830 [bacterium]|nr:hypothetical protein [bacterium]
MNFDLSDLDAVLREDLYSFIRKTYQTLEPMQQLLGNWHLEAIARHLERCMTGEIRRLIITLPPRSLKSISASVAFPAYVLGHDPTKKILCVSYSADLAVKNARECRSIMQSDWYRRLFPHTRLGSRAAEHDFHTTQRGYRYTTSVCGTLTGRGGNIIIIDDPMKAEEAMSDVRRKSINEWFDNTLYSRLDNKKSDVIILIMQRLHMDDMVGQWQLPNTGNK